VGTSLPVPHVAISIYYEIDNKRYERLKPTDLCRNHNTYQSCSLETLVPAHAVPKGAQKVVPLCPAPSGTATSSNQLCL
jgi:hypothetical protein